MAPAKRPADESQFKLQASSYAEEHGSRAAAREFKINESMVRKLGKQENELHQVKKTKLSFRGKNSKLRFAPAAFFTGCRDSRTETAVGTTPLAGHASLDIAGATLQEHTHTEACEAQQVKESDVMESLPPPPPQPFSAPADHTQSELRKLGSPTSLPEADIYKSLQPAYDDHDSVAVCAESHYDVPPRRKEGLGVRRETESLYDVPLSNRSAAADPAAENIYDVPSNLLRKMPDYSLALSSEEQRNEEAYWRI